MRIVVKGVRTSWAKACSNSTSGRDGCFGGGVGEGIDDKVWVTCGLLSGIVTQMC